MKDPPALFSAPQTRSSLVVTFFVLSMLLSIRAPMAPLTSFNVEPCRSQLGTLPEQAPQHVIQIHHKDPPKEDKEERSQGLHAPNSTLLPLPNDNGIILFFLHIPKTGGTTVMEPFAKNPDWRFRMVYGWSKQERYRQEMFDWLEHWEPGTKVYYEYHAGKASPYMDLQVREDLLVWKAKAKVRNIPFFAFTVVREPVSMAISHFNFYYANGRKKDPRYFWVPNATEQDFMQLSVPNPQCLFCIKGEVAYYEEWRKQGNSIESTPQGCKAVYDAFLNDLDWVGTTNRLSTETFYILEKLGQVKYHPEIRNRSRDVISKQTLSEGALKFIQNTTILDRSIYLRAKKDFPFEMWENLDNV